MRLVAGDVTPACSSRAGHDPAEEAPGAMLAEVMLFLAQ